MMKRLGLPDDSQALHDARDTLRVLMSVDAVGGVWRYALDLAQSLQKCGVRVKLIGFGPAPSPAQKAEARAAKIEVDWRALPLDWTPGGLSCLGRVRSAIAQAARAFDAHVVQVNSIAFAGPEIAAPVVAVGHSCIPTWWRAVRGVEASDWLRPHLSVNRAGVRAATLVVAPTKAHASQMQEQYGDLDIRIVHNASAPDGRSRLNAGQFVFSAGRWWDDGKNAPALDAAAGMTRRPIAMAGPLRDPHGGASVAIAHAQPLGPLDSLATREWMRRASVYAAPSLYEPFGLSVLEAAHAGTPLVLADIASFRELWDGAALFASPRDPADFADAIERLMTDPPLRAAYASRARERAEDFKPERQAEAMTAIYREAQRACVGVQLRSAV